MDRAINFTLIFLLLGFLLGACVRPALELTPRARLIDVASNSIVRITGNRGEQGPLVCTGEVVRPYRALTAAHCAGSDLMADGGPVQVLNIDPTNDLMLLALQTSKPPITLSNRPAIRFQTLTAIGYAHGATILTPLGVHVIIVGASPFNPALPHGLTVQGQYIPGMSGGPLVDDHGEMVGLIQMADDEGLGYGAGIQAIRGFLQSAR